MEMFNLSNKIIILTGAAGLLGTEYVDILSKANANIILVDIKKKETDVLAKKIMEKYHTNPLSLFVDISDKKSVEDMVDLVIEHYGRIDILINNAICNLARTKKDYSTFEDYPLENWNKIINVNMTGVFLCCQCVGKQMVKQKYGNIINISSIYGMVGGDQRIYANSKLNTPISYAATKAAVINMSRYLASYWQGKNIRVNTLSLGGVKYKQDEDFIKKYSYRTIIGRMANKDEYRGVILFLCSDASSYMNGANIVVDGGWTAW